MSEGRDPSPDDLLGEIWMEISGWPGYEVSNQGNVRFQGELRTLTTRSNGYRVVGLWHRITKKAKAFRVNVLVCHAFHPDTYFEGAYSLHKNHIRDDNRAANLYWGTQARNIRDMVEAGRATTGGRNNTSKLDWEKAKEIRRLHTEEGVSGRQLGIMFGVNTQTINCLLRGETWKESIC